MHKKLQLAGYVSERLTVIERAHITAKNTYWICRCSCDGMYSIIPGKGISSGAIRSCGCLKREMNQRKAATMTEGNKLAPGEAAFNLLYLSYAWHADERGYSFELPKEEFRLLTKGDCFYCGVRPLQITGNKYCTGKYTYNGIDRQNNDVGYNAQNCVSCCGPCNKSKGKRTVEQFLTFCKSVANLHQ